MCAAATMMTGISLGRALLQTGELERMRSAALPASVVFDRLDAMLRERTVTAGLEDSR